MSRRARFRAPDSLACRAFKAGEVRSALPAGLRENPRATPSPPKAGLGQEIKLSKKNEPPNPTAPTLAGVPDAMGVVPPQCGRAPCDVPDRRPVDQSPQRKPPESTSFFAALDGEGWDE